MVYLLYLVLAPLCFFVTFFVAYPLAPIMVLFKVNREWWCDNHSYVAIGPVLPSWLAVFMTPDNTLDGDATFHRLNPPSYWSQVKWLWRNPAYSFALCYLNAPYTTSVKGDKTIKDNDNAKAGWCFVRASGLFQFTYVAPIGASRCLMGNLGWNIRALVDDNVQPKPTPYQATFAFTPFRLSGFR
jgi:hypothetical protein